MNNDYRDEDPWMDPGSLDPGSLAIANRQHDDRLRAEGISIEGRIKASWNSPKLSLRGPLTDRKIKAYQKAGFYSAEYKEARKRIMDKNRLRRTGNFIEVGGRLIYTP